MLKRIVNLVGSLVVAFFDRLLGTINRLMGRQSHSRAVVLAYHSVTASQRSRFARQMDILVNRSTPVRACTDSLPSGGGRYTAVTFDDGLENIIENALPELEKRRIHSTLFIVTEVLGANPGWEYFGGDDPSQQRTMSEVQLRKLPSVLVTIGSHTMTHPVLPTLDSDQLAHQLVGSRSKLEAITGQSARLLSFPYGAFDEKCIEACRKAGYERVFTALPVRAFAENNEFVTGRVGVTPTDWPVEFSLKIEGAYRWLPYAFSLKRKILSLLGGRGRRSLQLKIEETRAL